jgi:hypothetical protein
MIRIKKTVSYTHFFTILLGCLIIGLPAFGQHTVNPGRPSFSENNHIVPKFSLQGENGFSLTENGHELNYAFNTLLRMGLSKKWETRIFSGIETVAIEGETGLSEMQTSGLGFGLKYLVQEEKSNRPSVGILAQSFVPSNGTAVNTLGFLATKDFEKISAELNINPSFTRYSLVELAYIICVGYGMGKVSVFAEGMLNDKVGLADELWVQGGASYLINPAYQIDFSAASYGPKLSNQMFQVGLSFLVLSRSQKNLQTLAKKTS